MLARRRGGHVFALAAAPHLIAVGWASASVRAVKAVLAGETARSEVTEQSLRH
jgi:hypothetical protein